MRVLYFKAPAAKNYRLPTSIRPNRYELTIKPYFNTTYRPEIYNAHIKIYFSVFEETNKFVIHSLGLKINFTSLVFLTSGQSDPFADSNSVEWIQDNTTNLLEITLLNDKTFKSGQNYSFSIDYVGFTIDNNVGFYRSSYLDSDGVRKLESEIDS